MNTEPESRANEYLKGIVANLPEKPGIYQYLNTEGTIIYVGKAKNLKKRVYSYFSKEHEPGKTRVLVSKIADIRYIVVNTEEDALLLENNLIKKYKPRYNVLLRMTRHTLLFAYKTSIFPEFSEQGRLSGTVLRIMDRIVTYHHVCGTGSDKAFISFANLQFKPNSGEYTGW